MDGLIMNLNFDNVQLVPRRCIVKSRKDCDTTVFLGKRVFRLPVIPANMKSVVNRDICSKLAFNNYMYINHRFYDNTNDIKKYLTEQMNNAVLTKYMASISIGIGDKDIKLLQELRDIRVSPEYITIDVAHAYSEEVRAMIHRVSSMFPDAFLIVGNICTREAAEYMNHLPIDCIKVGIATGKICTTREKTGFGSYGWQLSAIKECAEISKFPIIADGGIRNTGDIVKCLVFGATMVMAGNIFAGCVDSPCMKNDEGLYYGSASKHNNKKDNIEGTSTVVESNGLTILEKMDEIKQDLQSAISYAGGKNLSTFKTVDYRIISNG